VCCLNTDVACTTSSALLAEQARKPTLYACACAVCFAGRSVDFGSSMQLQRLHDEGSSAQQLSTPTRMALRSAEVVCLCPMSRTGSQKGVGTSLNHVTVTVNIGHIWVI
jgi:hypothetical protein